MSSYQERVEAFVEALQPIIEEKDKFYENLPIGTKIWVPCGGIKSHGIKPGHVGRIDTYLGNQKHAYGEWTSLEEATQNKIYISGSSSFCPSCTKIDDETKINST